MDDATRAERKLGDAIGRHIIAAIDAGFQPPRYVAYVSVSGAAGVWTYESPGGTDRFIVCASQGRSLALPISILRMDARGESLAVKIEAGQPPQP